MVNSAVLIGRVGQDPETKFFESGKVKSTFSIAVDRWNSKTKEQTTDWFNIEVWDKQAEFVGEWVKKGSLVSIEGRLASSKWTAPDGAEVERYFIRGQNVRFVGAKRDSQQA